MNIVKATAAYEVWLAKRIPLLAEDLALKHQHMREGVFPFLRATFYRWSQRWPEVSPKSAAAPEVLGVGDLHVENFGTWRDIEGRLVWGINDFDEACWLPYTCDLVRLATSAHFAISMDHLKLITPAKASQVIRSAVATAMRLVAAGVIAGLLVAAFSTRLLANQLYDVAPLDPLTFGLVAATMALAAFAAALVPASRATRVDPAVALRYE